MSKIKFKNSYYLLVYMFIYLMNSEILYDIENYMVGFTQCKFDNIALFLSKIVKKYCLAHNLIFINQYSFK